jgi:NAD(P)-dependent dehydrogenase (short-subunit alcohol dehydrogenase family)
VSTAPDRAAATEVRNVLVTGASSGIGAAVARALGKLGWAVALGARRGARLEEVARDVEKAGGRPFVHALDIALPSSIDTFFDAAERELGPVDVLVNNAGVCIPGLLHEVSPPDLELEVATNLLGPLLLARRAVRSMLDGQRRGDLVFVSSENAIRPRPFQIGYTATKMGIEGAARVLRMELEGTGIRAAIVRPGPTGTEFGRSWDPGLLKKLLEVWRYWGLQRHLHWMPPESVARAVVNAVTAPVGTHFDVIEVMPEVPRNRTRSPTD